MTFEEYVDKVLVEKRTNPYVRLGQAAWDILYMNRPDLFNYLIEQQEELDLEIDPVYDDSKLMDFKRWVKEHWNDF